jgi:hypothetical protein
MAYSQNLDAWVRRDGAPSPDRHHTEISLNLRKTINRTSELVEGARRQQRNFLSVEISTGLRMARLARLTGTREGLSRRTAQARRAYDEANRHFLRAKSLPKQEVKKLKAGLRELKSALEELGERF